MTSYFKMVLETLLTIKNGLRDLTCILRNVTHVYRIADSNIILVLAQNNNNKKNIKKSLDKFDNILSDKFAHYSFSCLCINRRIYRS